MPPMPPTCPREVTSAAQRRSLREGRVLLWWISAVVVAAIAISISGWQSYERWRIDWYAEHGVAVPATLVMVNDTTRWNATVAANIVTDVKIEYSYNGKQYQAARKITSLRSLQWDMKDRVFTYTGAVGPALVARQLATGGADVSATASALATIFATYPQPAGMEELNYIAPGRVLPIYIDPKDPETWLEPRRKPTKQDTWLVSLLLAPAVLICIVVGAVQRRRLLRLWREEPALAATVVEARLSGAWPLSRYIRFRLDASGDRRLFGVTVPLRSRIRQKGQSFWLVARKSQPRRAIVAELYDPSLAPEG